MKILLILLIRVYQKTLSPDHGFMSFFYPGGACRYYPTCSEYAVGTLRKHGSMRGVPRIVRRIVRCNPWSGGGVDEP